MSSKKIFMQIYNKYILKRDGAKEFLEWLETTDFFTAPASTKYHGAYEGGLVDHSLNVYKLYRMELIQWCQLYQNSSQNSDGALPPELEEFAAVCALLHDVCKINFYKHDSRNVKNSEGIWEKVPFYSVNDQFPYGHGEKSVFLIERKMRLKLDEAMAIRWHMGAFDDAVQGGSRCLSSAYSASPLAMLLHVADLKATFMMDKH